MRHTSTDHTQEAPSSSGKSPPDRYVIMHSPVGEVMVAHNGSGISCVGTASAGFVERFSSTFGRNLEPAALPEAWVPLVAAAPGERVSRRPPPRPTTLFSLSAEGPFDHCRDPKGAGPHLRPTDASHRPPSGLPSGWHRPRYQPSPSDHPLSSRGPLEWGSRRLLPRRRGRQGGPAHP